MRADCHRRSQGRRRSAGDVATLDKVLAGEALPFAESFDPVGDWRCRTIKLGGAPALIVYGWFKCRISDDGSGWDSRN